METITFNGIEYMPVAKPGQRAVIVIDRGWIFAGDVTRQDGRIHLTRCVWVFKWSSCGFAAVIDDPSNADIRPHADINLPAGAEIFSVPVPDDWGLQ